MRIIFHHPLPLQLNATSASGIRPLKMLKAFEDLGYIVDTVTGYSTERKSSIKAIKKKIELGVKYDFVYSESSTMPTILTDTHHLPLNPLLDFNLFRFCKNSNIPIGLFYRDIYWIFDGYGQGLNPLKIFMAKLSYKYDLYSYSLYLTKLYLPSMEMGQYIPFISDNIFAALPPGHDIDIQDKYRNDITGKLKIFYVGGMSDHYQMHILFSVINQRDDIELILCTRESEWDAVKSEYPELSKNIKIVHKSGGDMRALMADSDIVSIFVKPQEYWEFAAPVKLYEYLGNRKPMIASQGTLAGSFVAKNKIGWSLPYKESALNSLFDELISSPKLIEDIQQQMSVIAELHTWQARAKQVVKDLAL